MVRHRRENGDAIQASNGRVNQTVVLDPLMRYPRNVLESGGTAARRTEIEKYLDSVLETAPDAVIAFMSDGTIVSWNASAERMLGWSRPQAVGRNVVDLLALPAEREENHSVVGSLASALATSKEDRFLAEASLIRRDGVAIPCEIAMSRPVNLDQDTRYVVFVREISGRKQAERELNESISRFHAAMEQTPILFVAMDPQMQVTFAEGRALADVGLDAGTLLGVSVLPLLEGHDDIRSWIQRSLAGEEIEEESEFGGRYLHGRCSPIRDASGAITGVTVVGYDITHRHQAEARTKATLGIARQGLANAPLPELMQSAVQLSLQALGVELGSVFELEPGDQSAIMLASAGYSIATKSVPRVPGSLLDSLIEEATTIAVSDYADSTIPCPGNLRDEGVRSTLSTPIGGRSGSLGFLSVHSRAPRAWTDDEIEFIQVIGNILWVAVDRQRADADRRLLLSRLVDAQEQERRRIAADVHDDAVQIMTAVSMRLHLLRQHLDDQQQAATAEALQGTVSLAIERLRTLLFELTPPALERHGLAPALRVAVDQFQRDTGIEAELRSTLSSDPGTAADIAIYRIVQEALANVRKHSQAKHVRVELCDADDGVRTKVVDDGQGLDLARYAKSGFGHIGLLAMRERAEMAGGWWRIDSRENGGTLVEFCFPLAGPVPRQKGVA